MLQVNFFFVFNEIREVGVEVALDDAPKTACKVSFSSARLVVVLYLAIFSRVVEGVDIENHILFLFSKLVQVLMLGYAYVPFRA